MKKTLRSYETEMRYQEVLAKRKVKPSASCVICGLEDSSRFMKMRHWRVLENAYPYDRIAEESYILAPKRCVELWCDLTAEEIKELIDIKEVCGGLGIDAVMWNTKHTQSVPAHYHEHMLRFIRE